MHHGEKESDRERTWKGDSLLFHFISAFFCSNLVGRMTRMSAAERVRGAKERKRRERAATTRIASDRVYGEREMQQGEIVQCQGYMGARAQNRPYAEQGQDRSETVKRKGVKRKRTY